MSVRATVFAALALLLPPTLHAQAPTPVRSLGLGEEAVPQVECCQTLLLPVGARLVALGQALGSRSTPDAVFSNPAGLATLEERHLVLHTAELPGGEADAGTQTLAATLILTPRDIGALGFTYRLLDFGSQPCLDETGANVGALTIRYHVLLGSFATRVGGGLRAGLNYKLYTERFGLSGRCPGNDLSARTQGLDLGVQYTPPALPDLALGVALTDLGFALQTLNAEQSDPLPLRLHLAGSYELLHHFTSDTSSAGWISVEAAIPPPERGLLELSVGAELAFQDMVFLRGGWVSGEGLGTGPALGLGVRYRNFTVSVARTFQASPLAGEDPPLDLSLGVQF
ncbi:MAG TPA: hypothetical protein VMK65_14075 [Longimicrobiales bacterium]|nr:hypothetical protein [Longimicrobiales bacterium]